MGQNVKHILKFYEKYNSNCNIYCLNIFNCCRESDLFKISAIYWCFCKFMEDESNFILRCKKWHIENFMSNSKSRKCCLYRIINSGNMMQSFVLTVTNSKRPFIIQFLNASHFNVYWHTTCLRVWDKQIRRTQLK